MGFGPINSGSNPDRAIGDFLEPILEKKKLQDIYNIIADSWTNLRSKPKDFIVEISKKINGNNILDLGCGNCSGMIPFLERKMMCVGLDYSKSMIREAKKLLDRKKVRGYLTIGDVINLPFKNSTFDVVLYIAAFHHIPTRKLRLISLEEIKRTTPIKCNVYIAVWNRMQFKFVLKLFISLFKKKYEFGDIFQPWNYHGKTFKRFYHLYTKHELETDIETAGFKINKIDVGKGYNRRNIFMEVSK